MPKNVQTLRNAALLAVAGLVALGPAVDARGLSLIRDAEIEETIRAYAEPIFVAAQLNPRSITVHIVNDPALNAFVAGGQRIFVHTGLLLAAERPSQLIGVIAHETGHIAGGHLSRFHQELKRAQLTSILGLLAGVAAGIAARDGRAAAASATLGTTIAQRTFLQYNRAQEAAADQAGLSYLEETGQSAVGLLDFLQKLSGQDLLVPSRQDPYTLSHPLSSSRIEVVRHHISRSAYSNAPERPEFVTAHIRMQAKLRGFLKKPRETLKYYPPENVSLEARYARAAAYHRSARLDEALREIDSLLVEAPNDPYFNELKGQILYESGKVPESIPPLVLAARLKSKSPLIRLALAQSLVATQSRDFMLKAIEHLEAAVARDRDLTNAWYYLAVAYGRTGDLGRSALASAEQYLSAGDFRGAQEQAQRAQSKLAQGSPGWLRAQDIAKVAERERRRQGRYK